MNAVDYAQARIQARHGARPHPGAWAALHASITLATLLEAARASALEPWIAGLEAGCSLDDLELLLRERLRGRIAEVARWMPAPWRPAVLWTGALLDLPALQRLAWERPAAPWMARDPALAPRLAGRHDAEDARFARRAWLDTWRSLWPRCDDEARAALDELVHAMETHIEAFARAPPDEAWNLRLALQARVETLFRRHALTPAAAFDHLALLALDAERLRAELVARAAARAAPAP